MEPEAHQQAVARLQCLRLLGPARGPQGIGSCANHALDVAHIQAHPDHIDLLKAELEKLIAATRAEQGCLQYDLHQGNSDPARFMFYENWTSRALWQTHMGAPHLAAYLAATEGKVLNFSLHELTVVG